jgi:hypothetical protein
MKNYNKLYKKYAQSESQILPPAMPNGEETNVNVSKLSPLPGNMDPPSEEELAQMGKTWGRNKDEEPSLDELLSKLDESFSDDKSHDPYRTDEEFPIPKDPSNLDPKWIKLLEQADGIDPLTQKPSQSKEEILNELYDSEAPPYEKEILKTLNPHHLSDNRNAPTRPPGKKAHHSPDQILKLCSKFNDICSKF